MKEEIVEGLRYALAKGETLEKAMMSFFNAGYPREDIEEAANFLNAPSLFQNQQTPGAPNSPTQTAGIPQSQQPNIIQNVSAYGTKTSSSGRIITTILIALLFLLLGVLVSVFLFREELADFLNTLL